MVTVAIAAMRRGIAILAASTLPWLLSGQSAPAPYAPPGKMVEVQGRRLHLYCTGVGSPAVIVTGAGFSFDWALVQPELARFTRVCTYDPAGMAWSDAGAAPSCAGRVSELRELLAKAEVRGPLVLVGLSVGALVARTYVAEYPVEIAGMVFVDHAFLDPGGAAAGAEEDKQPGPIGGGPKTLTLEDVSDFASLPPRSQALHRWAAAQHPAQFGLQEARQCVELLAGLAKGETAPLGKLPLAVISTANHTDGYEALQGQLLNLSHDSKQFLAGHSFHAVEIDQPEVVVRAVREVVEAVRLRRPVRR